jgi:hypothetical protein
MNRLPFLLIAALLCSTAFAAHLRQLDIPGPAGSMAFGSSVTVLPNGNIVVTDPFLSSNMGAVYLYDAAGTLISSVTGSTANDYVGLYGVTVLANGNFVIANRQWHNGSVAQAGAVTWVNGVTGLSGVVSVANSLVGTKYQDDVGGSVVALNNGNYVVLSPDWGNGSTFHAGAVTLANGSTGVSGAVSAANSVVGITASDAIGSHGITELANGNFVISSRLWNNGAATQAGAATWVDGSIGLTGAVSATNSLIGTQANDYIGISGVTALSNGNYVVASRLWANGATAGVGAVTWANGSTGLSGPVTVANSLIGSTANDLVGFGGTIALNNGNYVVNSFDWNNGAATQAGAITWANGGTGLSGVVSAANSLVGSTSSDVIGSRGVIALSNGNYVVGSSSWHNGAIANAGAATWANGSTGLYGAVSTANSLVGNAAGDFVGYGSVALSNGNYVVCSPNWANGANSNTGAVTWRNGSIASVGVVSVANSLVGSAANDHVGNGVGVIALSNGNYVVSSPNWSGNSGAATWANGSTGLSGVVSASNSLVGGSANDFVAYGLTALSNGNYVVASPDWANGSTTEAGAVTWASGTTGMSGTVSAANSLVGTTANDVVGSNGVGMFGVFALSNGNYAVLSYNWNNGAAAAAGAVSLGRGTGGMVGPILAKNSVLGQVANGGSSLVFAYGATRDQLVVGQPAINTISLFDGDFIFADGFE